MENHLKECMTKKEKLFLYICQNIYIPKMLFNEKNLPNKKINTKHYYKAKRKINLNFSTSTKKEKSLLEEQEENNKINDGK